MSEDLTIVYGGMLEEIVGEGAGLTSGALDTAAEDVKQGHAALAEKRASGELGFFDLPAERPDLAAVLDAAADFRDRFENVIVLGIGGSAFGTTALVRALTPPFGPKPGACRVRCLDNVDPHWFGAALRAFPEDRTGYVVISQSGSTPETFTQHLVVRDLLRRRFGDGWKDHIVIITDPERGPLRAEADALGARSFAIPPNVGARFAVFTPMALFPAACAGIDVGALLDGALAAQARCETDDLWANPGYLLGTLLTLADQRLGLRNHVIMPYRQGLWETALWFRLLWAESLGKSEGVGPTPIVALGATDQHSQMQLYMEGPRDKVLLTIEVEDHGVDVPVPADAPEGLGHLGGGTLSELLHAELIGTRAALLGAKRPVMGIRLPVVDERRVGALMQTFMSATAIAGELYGIDAFDQPGVEAGKINAAALLGQVGLESEAETLRRAAEEIENHRL